MPLLVVGHSEGAWIAAVLGAREAGLAGVALLSGGATRGEQVLLWQAAQIAPTLPRPVRVLLRLLCTDLVTEVAKNHAKVRATTKDVARVDGAEVNARWMREFLDHDPAVDLARLRMPVLARSTPGCCGSSSTGCGGRRSSPRGSEPSPRPARTASAS